MALVVFEHEPEEGSAVIGQVLQRHGHRLRIIDLHRGDALPVDLDNVDGVISMGGKANVDQTAQYKWLEPEAAYLKQAHDAGLPVVGVCLGAQLIAKALGGAVAAMDKPEVGWHKLTLDFAGTTDPLFAGIAWDSMQFHMHGQHVTELPAGAVKLAKSQQCTVQAFRVGLTTYGFQYHFEWTRPQLQTLARNPLVVKAGQQPQHIIDGIDRHYDTYRRLGDRLCENIAAFLMPIDKR